jgi:hypothetical protein
MKHTTEILIPVALAVAAFGPPSLRIVFARIARAKAEFDDATRTFKTQFAAEPNGPDVFRIADC